MWQLRSFSLRTALILFLVLGAGLGMAARWVQGVRDRGNAQLRLFRKPTTNRAPEGELVIPQYASEQERSWFVGAVRKVVHPEYDRRLRSVSVFGGVAKQESAENLSQVFALESLGVRGVSTEAWLATALQAPGVRWVAVSGNVRALPLDFDFDQFAPPSELDRLVIQFDGPVRSELTQWLCRSPKLATLWIEHIDPTNLAAFGAVERLEEFSVVCHQTSPEHPELLRQNPIWNRALGDLLDELAKRRKLTRLRIFSAQLYDPAIWRTLCEQSELRRLHLEGCFLDPRCLQEIARLKKLETLHLHWTPLTSEHLEILKTMKGLRGIHALRCGDDEAVKELEAALPKCKVTRYLK
jgi:hypothetical protein